MYLPFVCVCVCVCARTCANPPAGVRTEGLEHSQSGKQEADSACGAGRVDQQRFTQETGAGRKAAPGHRGTEVHCQKTAQ